MMQNLALRKLMDAGMPFDDARSSLDAYLRNPSDPGMDGLRAKAILDKDKEQDA